MGDIGEPQRRFEVLPGRPDPISPAEEPTPEPVVEPQPPTEPAPR